MTDKLVIEQQEGETPELAIMRAFKSLTGSIPRHHAIAAANWMRQIAIDRSIYWAGDEAQSLSEAMAKANDVPTPRIH